MSSICIMSTRYGVWEGEEPRTGPSAAPPSTTCLIPADLSCKPAGCSLQYLAEDFKTIVLVEQESVMKQVELNNCQDHFWGHNAGVLWETPSCLINLFIRQRETEKFSLCWFTFPKTARTRLGQD